MIKLLDIHSQNKHGCVALLFADTREEVPEVSSGLIVDGLPLPVLEGSIIVTSGFEYAFVMSNGAIHWKGEDAPNLPVKLNLIVDEDNVCRIAYIDTNKELATETYNEGTYELTVLDNTTVYIVPGDSYTQITGKVTTTADSEVVYVSGDTASENTIVLINGETTITIGE